MSNTLHTDAGDDPTARTVDQVERVQISLSRI